MSYGGRKMTPKGQMSSSGSGPAIMMMPNHIRASFMPDPPLRHLAPPKRRRPKIYPDDGDLNENGNGNNSNNVKVENNGSSGQKKLTKSTRSITGVAAYLRHFEHGKAPQRDLKPTPISVKALKTKKREEKINQELGPSIESYRKEQRESAGESAGMNCYNTLFVGRLAYEVTERKLLREFEAFGPVKDLKLITVKNDPAGGDAHANGHGEANRDNQNDTSKNKSRGYAFIEYEKEEDMKRAYRGADGMRIEGKEIVVDVERGHTVPNWLPRRLGGGLGGTRLGGKNINVTRPGRFDPKAKPIEPPHGGMMGGPPGGHHGPPLGRGGDYGYDQRGPPPGYHNGRGGGGGGPPPGYHGRGPPMDRGGYGGGGGGYGYDRRGPPSSNYNGRGGGPPPGYYNGPPGGDRGMKRDRDYGGGGRRDSRRPRY